MVNKGMVHNGENGACWAGVEVKLKKQLYPVLVSATHIPELTTVQRVQTGIQLGASVTLATMDSALREAIQEVAGETSELCS